MGKSIQLNIEGMTCTSCAAAVEKALLRLPRVQVAQVSFTGKKALLELADGAAPEAMHDELRRAVTDAGYAVVDPARKREEEAAHIRRERLRLIWSWVFTTPIAVLMLAHMLWEVHLLPPFWHARVDLLLAGVVIFGIGFPVIKSTVSSFRKLIFTMDSLIGIGAVAAYSTGILRLFGVGIGSFTAVGAMIIAINFIGNYIKVAATGRAGAAIRELLELGAKQAMRVESDGSTTVVEVTALTQGDIVRVKAGEKVPADGVIVRGQSSIDESMVTGESVPVDKGPGSQVIGATINQMGTIDVRVERLGEESFLAQIVALVEEAQNSRVPVQELADKVTAIFVPVILILSVLTFLVWQFVFPGGAPFSTAAVTAGLSAAIATLVIACPCALGLATPTALMVGMGFGAERGILIRNGEAIQIAKSLTHVVFDKTGTLTIGRPEVQDAFVVDDAPATLALVAEIEGQSEHPLARALAEYARERAADGANGANGASAARAPVLEDVQATPGHGMSARLVRPGVAPELVRVGSMRWLSENGAAATGEFTAATNDWKGRGMTVVGAAIGSRTVAAFALADQMKADATVAVARLHKLGLKTVMLTGDNATAAAAIAAQVGIDEVRAELLPSQKIEAIRDLQAAGHTVAMVGDGINDAPALKQAQVGIAIGTGTDIAIEAADVTLMSGNLTVIPRAVEISRRTFAKIRTNLFWAFFYNTVAIPVAVLGLLHPVVAELAMAASSITVVMNSLHLRRILRKGERQHGTV